jgi:hypothetical protein
LFVCIEVFSPLPYLFCFLLYQSSSFSTLLTTSRVIAVSIPDHEMIWSSAGLPGISTGSPVVYVNQDDASTNYVLLTHNSELIKPDNSTLITGHVTLLQTVKGHVVWTDSEWSREEVPKGYGPPAVVANPVSGKYTGGLDNSNDLVVWTSSDEEGRGPVGFMFALQLPKNFQEKKEEVSDLRTLVLKKVRWNAIARPVMNANGTNLFVGVSGSELRGWIGSTRFDETANWELDLVDMEADPQAGMSFLVI